MASIRNFMSRVLLLNWIACTPAEMRLSHQRRALRAANSTAKEPPSLLRLRRVIMFRTLGAMALWATRLMNFSSQEWTP